MIVFLPPLASGPGFWSGVRDLLPDFPTLDCDFAQIPEPHEDLCGLAALTESVHASVASHADGDVTVVGASLGALVALDLSTRYPESVQRLVLVDGVPVYPEPMQAMWTMRAATARDEGVRSLLEPTMKLWFSPSLHSTGGSVLESARQTFMAFDPERYAQHCEILATVDLRDAAATVRVPTLVVCGAHDAPPFVAASSWFEQSIPDTRVAWIEDGHHAAAMEFPAAFVAALRAFLGAPHSIP